jgi:signal transduction histidine kinase
MYPAGARNVYSDEQRIHNHANSGYCPSDSSPHFLTGNRWTVLPGNYAPACIIANIHAVPAIPYYTGYITSQYQRAALIRENKSPGMITALGLVAVITFVLMSAFQLLKTAFYPNIALWETHVYTIIFTTVLATFAAFFVLRRQQALLDALTTEVAERKRTEEALMRHTEELNQLHQQLETAHREANLYLDILTHDIRNTENVSNLYADLLLDVVDGEAAGYVEKLHRSIKKSIEILGTVSTIRRIHEAPSGLKRMDLDAVIRREIEQFPDNAIRYDRTLRQVWADDLLSEVFTNLIGNAVKYGGPAVEITLRVEDENGGVLISIEDTGPGVPDEHKLEVFRRYEQKKRGVGEGLGLYLGQILVERYGGRIWVDDRVPGRSDQGAAFRFMLREATQDAAES